MNNKVIKRFDLRATLVANIFLQLTFLLIFFYLRPNVTLRLTCLLAIGVYWMLVALLWRRRQNLGFSDRLFLRVGFGALLPLSAWAATYLLICLNGPA